MFKKFFLLLFLVFVYSCKEKEIPFEANYTWHHLKVTASAYNSVVSQTDSNPHITAFGDSLKPGLNYIAVSRDLYRKGLKRDTPVKIKGFDSIFFVKDRMHSRWKNKIDIYMGTDVKAAKKWGRKKVSISYGVLKPLDSIKK
ncbi:3D domain-containing protein [Mariniflexile gromovii]|uniref:3D domain-containing protein n=1 Tax=Mariniflexile gromovii TaxID=362523 RepID=A0ABS4BP99_9FLAO|nr:3D domain-containing protein [Mariniflexile gromovii]MBP0902347.1 3D domain-containing protein [Mariniflexile gromovii]